MKKTIMLTGTVIFILLSCSSASENSGMRPGGNDSASLKDAPFPVGAAVDPTLMAETPGYSDLLKREFTSLTAENHMKMASLSSSRGNYTFDSADYIVDFAKASGLRVHGHTLLWYVGQPGWVKDFSGSRQDWINMMEEYITDVVSHFKGRVTSWDVVNEAFEDDGSWRGSEWYDNIGEEYIELAFRAAHKADPEAVLFYNDYGTEYSQAKRLKVNEYVKSLAAKGVPIHGVGIQMHTNILVPRQDIAGAIRDAANTGLSVHISELDVSVNQYDSEPEHSALTEELAGQQAGIYEYVFETYMSIPAAQQFGITFWGLYDKQSFRYDVPDWPLVFDVNMERKPAYHSVVGLFSK